MQEAFNGASTAWMLRGEMPGASEVECCITADGQVVATLVRMVVPMWREYGLALDVHQFMHDKDYAAAVLEKARASIDPKLREQAAYIEGELFGPRAAPPKGASEDPRSGGA